MERDARLMRGERPFLFTNCMTGRNIDTLAEWIMNDALFDVPRRREHAGEAAHA
jgi:urease accessory protein